MSLFNQEKNFIFVHIPKTGGTSMESLGWIGEGFNKHYDMEYFYFTYNKLPDIDFDNIFKFAFVRDPYTRFASGVLGHAVPSNKMDLLLGTMGEDESKKIDKKRFTAFTLTHKDKFDDIIALKPQHSFVTIDGEVVMNFIGRFENLQEDFNKLCNGLGYGDIELPHLLQGTYTDYDWLYTPETRKIVTEHYSKDFDLFNYERKQ